MKNLSEHFDGCTFEPVLPEGCDLDKDRVLLHCCCGPCSTAILEWLVSEGIRPGLFFSNSNIVPYEEYVKRREELARYASSFGLEVVDDEYDHEAWLDFVRRCSTEDLASIPERGPRCVSCFEFRLRRAASFAASHSYTILTTTLASSRWKVLSQVDEAGRRAVEAVNSPSGKLVWWGQNWRKGGLQDRRNELIKSCNLYNQTWCGCEFSRRST